MMTLINDYKITDLSVRESASPLLLNVMIVNQW